MMETRHYTLIKPTDRMTPRVNPNVNCGFGVAMMCHRLESNKYPTLVGTVDRGEAVHIVGAGDIWEISVPSPQFCSEPKTALKKKNRWAI